MQSAAYPLKITTGQYEIISSGVVHFTNSEVKFELANLVVIYKFKTDSGEKRFDGEIVDGALIITTYNSNNSLGEGKLDPVEVGTLNGRRLFTTWYVNTVEEKLRQLNYTFMLAEV